MARRKIGVFVDWLADGYSDPILDEIVRTANALDVDILCFVGDCQAEDFPVATRHVPAVYASSSVMDGAVVVSMGNALSAHELELFFARFDPMPLASVAVQWTKYPSVEVDNETGVRAGVRHIISAHHRRKIACIRGPVSSTEADKRFGAYRQVLSEFGIDYDPRFVTTGYYVRQNGYDAVKEFLDHRKIEFDALVAANDAMALGALDELTRRGVRVPEDVALLGFDDIDEGRHARPPLSTVRQPVRAHGRKAFNVVLAQLNGEAVPRVSTIDSYLVLRKSCGCITSLGGMSASTRPNAPTTADAMQSLERWIDESCQGLERFLNSRREGRSVESGLAKTMTVAASSGDYRPFLVEFENGLMQSGGDQVDILLLLPILDAHRQKLRSVSGNSQALLNLDGLFRDASSVVSEVAVRVQAELRYRAETQIDRLLRMNEALLQTLDFAGVAGVIAERLPQLGVNACYVCVYEGATVPAEWARLVIACTKDGATSLPPDGIRFLAKEVLPQEVERTLSGFTWLICPMLRRENSTAAYVVIERGTAEAFVYDSLVDQIGSSFKRLNLMKQVVEEARLREIAERERIEREMQIATRIQTGILPRDVCVPGLEISARMCPATEVGGDYYDVVTTEDGCWIGVGDVAGHGLPTGLVMLMCQSVLGGLVRRSPDQTPEDVLSIANRLLYDNIRNRMHQDEHITLALYRYRSDGTIVYAGAHESALVWRARTSQIEWLETRGVWSGILEDISPMTQPFTARLDPGDLFVLYTDGVTEARNAEGEVFGEERLADAIRQCHDRSVASIRESIFLAAFSWAERQEDDMTLLVARYLGQTITDCNALLSEHPLPESRSGSKLP